MQAIYSRFRAARVSATELFTWLFTKTVKTPGIQLNRLRSGRINNRGQLVREEK
jgi:hypothetical protein